MTELRVTVPDEIAKRLASEAAERGTLGRRGGRRGAGVPCTGGVEDPFAAVVGVGAAHSGRDDLSERHEEILKSELGLNRLIVVDTGLLVALLRTRTTATMSMPHMAGCQRRAVFVPVPVVTETCYFIERDSGPEVEAEFLGSFGPTGPSRRSTFGLVNDAGH